MSHISNNYYESVNSKLENFMSRLVTQCESLRGFRNPRGKGENDAIVTEAKPRSLLRHSRPDRGGFKTEERLALGH